MRASIFFIAHFPLTKKVAEDWYIKELLETELNVQYWDISQVFYGGPPTLSADGVFEKCIRYFHTWKNLENALKELENENVLYVVLINFDKKSKMLYQILKKRNAKTAYFTWGAYPIPASKILKKVCYLAFSPSLLLKLICDQLESRLSKVFQNLCEYDVVFASGSVMLNRWRNANLLVPVSAPDFNRSKRVAENNLIVKESQYVVFLDVFAPLHPDHKHTGRDLINSDRYYASLNFFFNKFENKHNIKVIIAAHPKAKYVSNPFGGREIYYGITPELVSKSRGVITHHSSSFAYAIIFFKPIIFIYTKEMLEKCKDTMVDYMEYYAKYLGSSIYNIDSNDWLKDIKFIPIDRHSYSEYLYKYLTTPEVEDVNSSELVINCIRRFLCSNPV